MTFPPLKTACLSLHGINKGMNNPNSEYYTAREFAEKVGVHPQTVYTWMNSDPPKIPSVKIGAVRRIPKKEANEWLKERTIIP